MFKYVFTRLRTTGKSTICSGRYGTWREAVRFEFTVYTLICVIVDTDDIGDNAYHKLLQRELNNYKTVLPIP